MVMLLLIIICIKHVLSKFNNNKLTLNHSLTCSNSVKISVFKSVALLFVTITVVLSVKRTVLDLLLIMFGKSFV